MFTSSKASLISRSDYFVLILCILAVLITAGIANSVFENLPHTEDEISYLWQARVFAGGKLNLASPSYAENLLVPFVVDYHGLRFSKYPPGWPAILAIGVRLGLQTYVNPLLAGISIWLTYVLGKKIFNANVGLLAAVLTITSPFFLVNSGSFLSSSLSLVLTGIFAFSWYETISHPKPGFRSHGSALISGLSLGWLVLTRPLTALGVALPFGVGSLILFYRNRRMGRNFILMGIVTGVIGSLLFVWQYAMTGSPLLNPYILWWPFDKVGFGPGVGIAPGGHNLLIAFGNTFQMLAVGAKDLFGWGWLSWIFLPVGLLSLKNNKQCLPLICVFPALVVAYMFYWAYVTRFGPRYYYESLYSLSLLSAVGILWLAGRNKISRLIVMVGVGLLIGYNLFIYLPARLDSMRAIYGITRAQLQPFVSAQAQSLTPALVFVHLDDGTSYGNLRGNWPQYGGLLELENPTLTSPFIFAISSSNDTMLAKSFPTRRVVNYWPARPYSFYTSP